MFRRLWLCLLLSLALPLQAAEPSDTAPINIGLTPVFLDNQAPFINEWRIYLQNQLGRPVNFVQRGNYREIVNLLREGKIEFAWLCGYPYVRNRDKLKLVAVPLYQGEPLYQSYLIVSVADKKTQSLSDLRGKNFAFSDPDSNSGHLYTQYQLARMGEAPSGFFDRTFFTWSHRKVIEAVTSGLAQGGAIDGYVWDTLALTNPDLTVQTRIVTKSNKFGHPPFVAGPAASKQQIAALQQALFQMDQDEAGARLLATLNLNGFVRSSDRLFDEIENMATVVEKQRK